MTPTDRVVEALDLIAKRANLLAKLGPDLVRIIECDSRNSSTRDGYPGGGTTGPRGNTELTPTESAANQRMGRKQADEYHTAVINTLRALRRVEDDLTWITGLPERITAMQTVTAEGGNDSWCWVARQYGFSYDPIWTTHCHTTFNGYLAEPWAEPRPVCRQVYDRTRALRVLPSADELGSYLQRSVA